MGVEMTKCPKIECNECQEQYGTNIHSFDLDKQDDVKKGMEIQTNYVWEYEGTCEKCNDNKIKVVVKCWEYPKGFIEDKDCEGEGCKIIEQPILEIKMD